MNTLKPIEVADLEPKLSDSAAVNRACSIWLAKNEMNTETAWIPRGKRGDRRGKK